MNGSGNDFIIVDNRSQIFPEDDRPLLIRRLCQRQTGVGSDGLILLEDDSQVDFSWRFYNADGSEAEMCGNGGRCAARFAFLHGIAPERMVFRTLAGLIKAEIHGSQVKLQLSSPGDIRQDICLLIGDEEVVVDFINTGVPHVVIPVDDLSLCEVREKGRRIRFHDEFQPAGTNVNFISVVTPHELSIRTYERGVEDETLACGTGSVAASLAASARGLVVPPTRVVTRSGEVLTVYYQRERAGFTEVFLEGDAKIVYEGSIIREFLQ
ncbi:MAG: diaminopimelate epimerase [Deltaproteobacteria bacterium]|nr:diaminopimelate epimerase [Candidatus Anaeroferrophillus wilburensis]MBN2888121.1 diaminopimelate epimerase [Deltaproteobacteria bacterium]